MAKVGPSDDPDPLKKIEELTAKLNEAEASRRANEQKLSDLEAKLKASEQDANGLRTKNSELSQQLEEASEKYTRLENRFNETQATMSSVVQSSAGQVPH